MTLRPRCLVLLALLVVVSLNPDLGEAQHVSSIGTAGADTTTFDLGRAAGTWAGRNEPGAGCFWCGFIAGVPLGIAGTWLVLSGDAQLPDLPTVGALLGGAAVVALLADRGPEAVLLSPDQETLLVGADSAYAAGYREGFAEAAGKRGAKQTGSGVLTGALAGGAGLLAFILAIFGGGYT
jgi:hypothetical protein